MMTLLTTFGIGKGMSTYIVPSFLVMLLLILGWSSTVVVSASPINLFRDTSPYKGFSGFRRSNTSRRMVYFNEQTIAVVELGPSKHLENCELIEVYNQQEAKLALRNLTQISKPLQIKFDEMLDLMYKCHQLRSPEILARGAENVSTHKDSNELNPYTVLHGILPGTKWCGTGDIAETYFDLGTAPDLDRCCRTHDLCPVKVRAFQSRYNLINFSVYTKSHCACDDYLYKCLKKNNHSSATVMGNVYFNILQVPCLDETYPRVCVMKNETNDCVKWEQNRSAAPQLKFRTRRRQF